jgi:hypothetical protein
MCDNCHYWRPIELGHFGMCGIKAATTKWSSTCSKYIQRGILNNGELSA